MAKTKTEDTQNWMSVNCLIMHNVREEDPERTGTL